MLARANNVLHIEKEPRDRRQSRKKVNLNRFGRECITSDWLVWRNMWWIRKEKERDGGRAWASHRQSNGFLYYVHKADYKWRHTALGRWQVFFGMELRTRRRHNSNWPLRSVHFLFTCPFSSLMCFFCFVFFWPLKMSSFSSRHNNKNTHTHTLRWKKCCHLRTSQQS